jgi:hypothetical protein
MVTIRSEDLSSDHASHSTESADVVVASANGTHPSEGESVATASALDAVASGVEVTISQPTPALTYTQRLYAAMPYIGLVMTQVIWSFNTVFAKVQLAYMTIFVQLSFRFIFGILTSMYRSDVLFDFRV